jgi:hypothetical protein
MNNHFRIERISSSTVFCLIYLYKKVFNKSVSEKYLNDKFDTGQFGANYLGYLAFDQSDLPVAFYGVLPCQFKIGNKIVLAAQSGDTMTHPDHRMKGLFVLLAEKTYQLAKDSGVKFVFGFPNQNSLQGLKKLNWVFPQGELKLFRIDFRAIPFAKVTRKSTTLKKIYEKWARFKLRNMLIEGEKTHLPQSENGVLRDEVFLSYKKYNTSFHLNTENTYLWVASDGILKVGLMENSNLDLGRFNKRIREIAAGLGCNSIAYITSKDSPTYTYLSKTLESKDCFPVGFLNLSEGNFDFKNVRFEYCDIDIF